MTCSFLSNLESNSHDCRLEGSDVQDSIKCPLLHVLFQGIFDVWPQVVWARFMYKSSLVHWKKKLFSESDIKSSVHFLKKSVYLKFSLRSLLFVGQSILTSHLHNWHLTYMLGLVSIREAEAWLDFVVQLVTAKLKHFTSSHTGR